jgi:hypothetical protein
MEYLGIKSIGGPLGYRYVNDNSIGAAQRIP